MKKCQRPVNNCDFQIMNEYKQAFCNIRGEHYKCLDEETYMADLIEMKAKKKKRGEEEIVKIVDMIKMLVEYAEICPDPNALDRVSDATGHLRKTRLCLMAHYGIDFE